MQLNLSEKWAGKYFETICFVCILCTIIQSCAEEVKSKKPVVDSFTPSMGVPGYNLVISCANFSQTSNGFQVSFNGGPSVPAIHTYFPNSITGVSVEIPEGTTTGKFTVKGDLETAVSETNFFAFETTVSTIAGAEPGQVDGPLATSRFSHPGGIARSSDGTLYVTDNGDNLIRKISVTGEVTTLAGSTPGFADGPGGQAKFNGITGIVVDHNRNVIVSDGGNNRIRMVATDGTVTTLAGSVAGYEDANWAAALFNAPQDLDVDRFGNIYVADMGNRKVRLMGSDGQVRTLAPNAHFGDLTAILLNRFSTIYLGEKSSTGSGKILALNGGASVTEINTNGTLGPVNDIVEDPVTGRIFFATGYPHNRLMMLIPRDNMITTLAGNPEDSAAPGFDDGPGAKARFDEPQGVVVDPEGNLIVSDRGNSRIRKVTIKF